MNCALNNYCGVCCFTAIVFNQRGFDSHFEYEFASFLDGRSDVKTFVKNFEQYVSEASKEVLAAAPKVLV